MTTTYLETDILPSAGGYQMDDIVVLLKSNDQNVAFQKCGDDLWKNIELPNDTKLKDHQTEHDELGTVTAVTNPSTGAVELLLASQSVPLRASRSVAFSGTQLQILQDR